MVDNFPLTTIALWDGNSKGDSIHMKFLEENSFDVLVRHEVLKIAANLLFDGKVCKTSFSCYLLGYFTRTLKLQLHIDYIETKPAASLSRNDLLTIPFQVFKIRPRNLLSDSDFLKTLQDMQTEATEASNCVLTRFIRLFAFAGLYSDANDKSASTVARHSLSWLELVAIIPSFTSSNLLANPVSPVPISITAVAKHLTQKYLIACVANASAKVSLDFSGQFGLLTMDKTRKLVLLSGDDAGAILRPTVGVWVSDVLGIGDPRVWCICVHYLISKRIENRICPNKSNSSFLLVIYTPLHNRPQFYDVQFNNNPVPQPNNPLLLYAFGNLHAFHRPSSNTTVVRPVEVIRLGLQCINNNRQSTSGGVHLSKYESNFLREFNAAVKQINELANNNNNRPIISSSSVDQNSLQNVIVVDDDLLCSSEHYSSDDDDYLPRTLAPTLASPWCAPPANVCSSHDESVPRPMPLPTLLKPVSTSSSSLPPPLPPPPLLHSCPSMPTYFYPPTMFAPPGYFMYPMPSTAVPPPPPPIMVQVPPSHQPNLTQLSSPPPPLPELPVSLHPPTPQSNSKKPLNQLLSSSSTITTPPTPDDLITLERLVYGFIEKHVASFRRSSPPPLPPPPTVNKRDVSTRTSFVSNHNNSQSSNILKPINMAMSPAITTTSTATSTKTASSSPNNDKVIDRLCIALNQLPTKSPELSSCSSSSSTSLCQSPPSSPPLPSSHSCFSSKVHPLEDYESNHDASYLSTFNNDSLPTESYATLLNNLDKFLHRPTMGSEDVKQQQQSQTTSSPPPSPLDDHFNKEITSNSLIGTEEEEMRHSLANILAYRLKSPNDATFTSLAPSSYLNHVSPTLHNDDNSYSFASVFPDVNCSSVEIRHLINKYLGKATENNQVTDLTEKNEVKYSESPNEIPFKLHHHHHRHHNDLRVRAALNRCDQTDLFLSSSGDLSFASRQYLQRHQLLSSPSSSPLPPPSASLPPSNPLASDHSEFQIKTSFKKPPILCQPSSAAAIQNNQSVWIGSDSLSKLARIQSDERHNPYLANSTPACIIQGGGDTTTKRATYGDNNSNNLMITEEQEEEQEEWTNNSYCHESSNNEPILDLERLKTLPKLL